MQELSSFAEFIIDIFCFSISGSGDTIIRIPQYVPLIICIAGVVLLVFSLAQKFIETNFKNNKLAFYLITIAVIALSFGFISGKEYNFIFNVFYIPLIFVLRGLEGGLISTSFKTKIWLWILLPLICSLILIYILFRDKAALVYLTIIWSLVGITLASLKWVKVLRKNNSFSLNNLSFISIFIIFFGTMMFIPNSKGDQIIHLLMLPLGFIVGLIIKTKWFEELINKKTTMHNN